MSTLLVFLTDSLKSLYDKGEIKPRYYNPGHYFSEVHFLSPTRSEIEPREVQCVVGAARMVVHPVGNAYRAGFLPCGRLAALIRAIRPDVVRAYDAALRGSLAVYWARRLGIPSVVSAHIDLDDQRRYEQHPLLYLKKPFERHALVGADAVICVTRYVERYAKRHGARHTQTIYNKVYCEEFAPASGAHDPRGMVSILSVGRLVPQKYQECLIRALPPLRATLTLIGDGPLRGPLQALVTRLRLDDRVTFIPAVPHSEIARYYQDADVFAIATRYEGFCIPVLEAMATGMPIVASRIGPIEELLGDAGWLVENTPGAFTGALGRLINDPQLWFDLGARARARAMSLEGRVMEEREQALYRSLCRADDAPTTRMPSEPLSRTPGDPGCGPGVHGAVSRVRDRDVAPPARRARLPERAPARPVPGRACGGVETGATDGQAARGAPCAGSLGS